MRDEGMRDEGMVNREGVDKECVEREYALKIEAKLKKLNASGQINAGLANVRLYWR